MGIFLEIPANLKLDSNFGSLNNSYISKTFLMPNKRTYWYPKDQRFFRQGAALKIASVQIVRYIFNIINKSLNHLIKVFSY